MAAGEPVRSRRPPYCGSLSPVVRSHGTVRSARCSKIDNACSLLNWEPNRGVPFRSEKRALQVRQ